MLYARPEQRRSRIDVCRLGTGTFTLVLNEEMLCDAIPNPEDANTGDDGYSDDEDPLGLSPNAQTPDTMSPFAIGASPFEEGAGGFSPVAAGFSVCAFRALAVSTGWT